MILIERSVKHDMIHNENYQNMEAKWVFHMEATDIPDPVMLHRFQWVEVHQRKNLRVSQARPWTHLTWFKGQDTKTFGKETKDKQKQQVIAMVEKFILDNNTPLIHTYEVAKPNN
jgi:hypothetical protein